MCAYEEENMRSNFSVPDNADSAIRVRPYRSGDEAFVLSLAPRLLTGMPPWRSAEKWLGAVQYWMKQDFKNHGKRCMLFIAENEHGERLGFANVAYAKHFTGEPYAYLGELAVSEEVEGHGVGKALVHACEQWAREQGYSSLVLDTGTTDNERARNFYKRLGFVPESIKLTKLL
ncbi:GNAT family N-acetyltransferase [Ktedonosporobacter rubrisoli]|nr:GNAT family N-acetyltransferase [Ktedonosporobacter rubrisoli]